MDGALFVAGSSALWVAMAAWHTELRAASTVGWGHRALAVIAVLSVALAVDRPRGTWSRRISLQRKREAETTASWSVQLSMLGTIPRLTWVRLAGWVFVILASATALGLLINVLWGYSAIVMGSAGVGWAVAAVFAGMAWVEGEMVVWVRAYSVLLWMSIALTLLGGVVGSVAEGSVGGALSWLLVALPAALLTWQVLGRRRLGRGGGLVQEYWRWRVERANTVSSRQVTRASK